MSQGPGLFSDFGKKAKDILTKDYSGDSKFVISSESYIGVALVSTAGEKGGLSSGDVSAQYKYKNAIFDFKVDTESNISTILTVTDILPSVKTIASYKYPDYNPGKIQIQYLHKHASFTTATDLQMSPTVEFSATIGTPAIAFGTEAQYMVDTGNFAKYNAGVRLTKPNSCASVILGDKGDALQVSYLLYLDQLKRSSVVGEISRKFSTNENTLTVGCSYAADPYTVVKAKLNNHGKLGALIQHEVIPKSFLTISGNFDTNAMDKNPKFGLALSLNP